MHPNGRDPVDLVSDLYVEVCSDLLSGYGLSTPLRHGHAAMRESTRSFVSVLSATGEGARLLSTLNVDAALLAKMHPAGAETARPCDLEDWCRELNNQLMGRVKNRLLRFGCEVALGLPSLIAGNDMATVTPPDSAVREFCLVSAHGRISITLAARFDPRFELNEIARFAGREEVMREGALSLF